MRLGVNENKVCVYLYLLAILAVDGNTLHALAVQVIAGFLFRLNSSVRFTPIERVESENKGSLLNSSRRIGGTGIRRKMVKVPPVTASFCPTHEVED